jgi:hypothetical protein
MKYPNSFIAYLCLIVFFALASCNEGSNTKLEKLPYFDLKGFMDIQAKSLDSVSVILISRVNGKEVRNDTTLYESDWMDQFDTFIQADINRQSLFLAYDTQVKNNVLTHSLFPDEKEKLKEMKVTYIEDDVTTITLKMSEKNLFYQSSILAELYINNVTEKVDHYSIETTQKIWFLDPSNIKIRGAIQP